MAAWLLKRDGWWVTGLTMSMWDGSVAALDAGFAGCFGPGEAKHLAAAKANAERLGIEHQVVRLAAEYKETVLGYFRKEYLAGRTPNPCVRCNQQMKFGFLLSRAKELGVEFDYFATGHYARVRRDETSGRWLLRRGCDTTKDQSYFLSRLQQDQLAKLLFPLGEWRKEDVKKLAAEQGWADVAVQTESQDFVESKDYGVLFRPDDAAPGDFVTRDGRVLGRHRGILHYTIGQRKGLALGGGGTPWYVLEIDAARNRVVVGPQSELFHNVLIAGEINWLALAGPPEQPFRCAVQIRQQHKAAPATAHATAVGQIRVEFDEPQLSITPGQVAVLYDGDNVLASGIIEKLPQI